MSSINSIIILGDDEHAWFAAAMLAFNSPWLEVTVIGRQNNTNSFYATSTRGDCQHFFNTIGLPWQELLFSGSATCKLANRYINCSNSKNDFYHSYGAYGKDVGLLEFHRVVNALGAHYVSGGYDAYSLEAQAAKNGKFIVNKKSIWGLHYDPMALLQILKVVGKNLGVKHIFDEIVSLEIDKDAQIKQVFSGNGDAHRADFFIDARAFDRDVFTGKGVDDSSWSVTPLSDWCLTAYLDEQTIYLPVTEYRQIDKQYWIKKIPLQSKTVIELYGMGDAPLEQDFSILFSDLGYTVKSDSARLIHLVSGRRKNVWTGNCLLVGNAAVALGNLAFPALDVTRFQVEKFLKYFPAIVINNNLILEYNKVVVQAMDNVLDYHSLQNLILFNCAIGSEEFKNISCSLMERINFFLSTGRYELQENELIQKEEWISLLMGLEFPIKHHDALIGPNDLVQLAELLQSIRAEIVTTVEAMPNHLVFLSQILQTKNKR